MHRRKPKKIDRAVTAVFMAVILFLAPGCAVRQSGSGEELVELTDAEPQEIPEEEAQEETKEEGLGEGRQKDTGDDKDAGFIYVHVCGEVVSPGVYMIPSGSRLYEAIEAAGGLLESAAGELLNQAALAEDGQQVYVSSREEAAQGTASIQNAGGAALAADDGKVNLNTASREQLMTLSGIGEAKAASIIAYREEHGGFRKIEDLMEVEGIKEGVFNKVKDQIKIE